MAVVPITNTPSDRAGNFDIVVRGTPTDPRKAVQLQKSLGSGTTNWKTVKVYPNEASEVVVNVGTNSFRLAEDVAGVTVETNQ